MDDIIAGLTRPLTAEEKSPKAERGRESRPGSVFKGNLEEVNRFFYRRGWTDGLPVIPPTEAGGGGNAHRHGLAAGSPGGKLVPRLGKATVEKIAINAVMAGCLPTYMPVLIAGVSSRLTRAGHSFGTWGVSTGSWAPFWIINGPIRNEIAHQQRLRDLQPGQISLMPPSAGRWD